MIICLDLRYKSRSGASTYLHQLVPQILTHDRANRYVLVKYRGQSFPFEKEALAVLSCPEMPTILQIIWTNTVLPARLRALNVQVYHALKLAGYYWHPSRTVMTMHSTVARQPAENSITMARRIFIRFYARWLIPRAGRLVAHSELARRGLMSKYRIEPERIDVIPHGADDRFRPLPAMDTLRVTARLGLPRRYLLCVGSILPEKNHIAAVRALGLLKDKYSVDLVIAGAKNDPFVEKLNNEIGRLGLLGRVHMTGFLETEDLVGVMNGAEILLAPSQSEGSGAAVLNAFRCGLPAVLPRGGTFAEIGEGGSMFVDDPHDSKAIAAAVERVLESDTLRHELRARARSRASEFSWKSAALKHRNLYEEIAGGK